MRVQLPDKLPTFGRAALSRTPYTAVHGGVGCRAIIRPYSSSSIMRKHVVFVVDASRSMERRDVFEGGERKRRIDAVLDCCFEFIEVNTESRLYPAAAVCT